MNDENARCHGAIGTSEEVAFLGHCAVLAVQISNGSDRRKEDEEGRKERDCVRLVMSVSRSMDRWMMVGWIDATWCVAKSVSGQTPSSASCSVHHPHTTNHNHPTMRELLT